ARKEEQHPDRVIDILRIWTESVTQHVIADNSDRGGEQGLPDIGDIVLCFDAEPGRSVCASLISIGESLARLMVEQSLDDTGYYIAQSSQIDSKLALLTEIKTIGAVERGGAHLTGDVSPEAKFLRLIE